MWQLSEIICGGIMVWLSVSDIRIRKVSSGILAASGVGSILYHVLMREMDFLLVASGAFVGVIFILLSKFTNEGVGYGDSIGIMALGIFLGFWRILTVLSIAFLLLLCILIPKLWKRRVNKNFTLPFYPYLTGGYICLLLLEGMSV